MVVRIDWGTYECFFLDFSDGFMRCLLLILGPRVNNVENITCMCVNVCVNACVYMYMTVKCLTKSRTICVQIRDIFSLFISADDC